VDLVTLRAMTWATIAAAVVSALLLTGTDASLPDAGTLAETLATQVEAVVEEAEGPATPTPNAAPAEPAPAPR
jgi:hypothetical protein